MLVAVRNQVLGNSFEGKEFFFSQRFAASSKVECSIGVLLVGSQEDCFTNSLFRTPDQTAKSKAVVTFIPANISR